MRALLASVVAAVALGAAAPGSGVTPAAAAAPVPCADCWHPGPTTSPWQYQLQGKVDLSVPAFAYDIDGFDNSAQVVGDIHGQGDRAICYVSVGTWEKWRPDAGEFPESVKGRSLDPPFSDERWLDIRRLRVLRPIMAARFDMCARKGFDAVEPDNVDAYQNSTGFPLTKADQLRYDEWWANAVHRRGMAVALKNDLGQVRDLLPYVDFAVNEQCFQYKECDRLTPFVDAGKAVLGVEYRRAPSEFCPGAGGSVARDFSTIYKKLSLRAYRETCP